MQWHDSQKLKEVHAAVSVKGGNISSWKNSKVSADVLVPGVIQSSAMSIIKGVPPGGCAEVNGLSTSSPASGVA